MHRIWPRSVLLVACATTAFLLTASAASSHTLPVKKAKKAIKLATEDWYFASDLSERYWVNSCSRRSEHRVDCKAHIRGYNSDLGATETCTRNASARRPRQTMKVALADKTTCKFDYGDDDDGGFDPGTPPAPDTVITSGPAEGSTVSGSGPISFSFEAIGGEDPVFECSIDGAAFNACSSGNNFGFSPGPHTFRVRAVSIRLGAPPVPDPTPASRSFTVS